MPPNKRIQSVIDWAQDQPWIARIWRAADRYFKRLGEQFAGALTFSSILALVPILMLSFSLAGMLLTFLRPEWLDTLREFLSATLENVIGGEQVLELIEQFISGWRGVGIVGLGVGFFVGLGWVNAVRNSLHALCRPGLGNSMPERNFFVQVVRDIGLLFGVVFLAGLFLSSGAMGSWLGPHLLGWLGVLPEVAESVLVNVLALGLALGSSYVLYVFLFRVVADVEFQPRALRQGAILAAVATTLLQIIAPWLIGLLGRNRGVQLFGSVIVVMVMVSIFARILLICAAWTATANQPSMPRHYIPADKHVRQMDDALTVPGHWESVDARTADDEDE